MTSVRLPVVAWLPLTDGSSMLLTPELLKLAGAFHSWAAELLHCATVMVEKELPPPGTCWSRGIGCHAFVPEVRDIVRGAVIDIPEKTLVAGRIFVARLEGRALFYYHPRRVRAAGSVVPSVMLSGL